MGRGFCIVFTMSFPFHSFALKDDKFCSLGDIHTYILFICLIVSLWNNMIRSLSFCPFSPFKTFLVCMHFCYWAHTIICQLKLLYTLCINLVLFHDFFHFVYFNEIFLSFLLLAWSSGYKSIHTSFFHNEKRWWAAWMNASHTHILFHLIYARILWEKALQVHMILNEKVHTKWKPMRYYYYMLVMSTTRLGHSTSSRSKNWMPNLWPKLIFITWTLWRFCCWGWSKLTRKASSKHEV